MENPNYKNENIGKNYLHNVQKSKFLKVKKSAFRIRKTFYRVKPLRIKR